MRRYADFVTNLSSGRAVAGASVRVLSYPSNAVSTIYQVNGVGFPGPNPVTTAADGFFAFYAPDGRYTLEISYGGEVKAVIEDVLIEDPVDPSEVNISEGEAAAFDHQTGVVRDAVAIEAITKPGGIEERMQAVENAGGVSDGRLDALEVSEAKALYHADTYDTSGVKATVIAASLPDGAHVRVAEDETATPAGIAQTYTVASGLLTDPVADTAMNILYAGAQDGASLAELPIPNLPPERTVIVPVAGFYSAGDGGGGQFYWQYNSNETPVPGMIINPAGNVGAGRWKRVVYSGVGDVVDLTYSASLDWDMNDGYMFRVTLTGDTELQLPANLKPGTHIMYVYQDAIGGHIMTFQTGYRAPRGLLPVLSTIPDGVDILTFVSDGVKVDVNIQANMLEG